MCCRTSIAPLDVLTAHAILAVGQFIPNESKTVWIRKLEEEGTAVTAQLQQDCLSLSISPAISSDEGHAGKRQAAGVYFEIAARYAEKVEGVITQHSNIGECRLEGGSEKLLAQYPAMPLSFLRICPGLRALFMSGIEGTR